VRAEFDGVFRGRLKHLRIDIGGIEEAIRTPFRFDKMVGNVAKKFNISENKVINIRI
jgi:hypothetical protein